LTPGCAQLVQRTVALERELIPFIVGTIRHGDNIGTSVAAARVFVNRILRVQGRTPDTIEELIKARPRFCARGCLR
jgi:hypothetical protein